MKKNPNNPTRQKNKQVNKKENEIKQQNNFAFH